MDSQAPTLFLLDAMALIFRAYYALANSPRITSTGKNTNAQFGFTNSLLELLTKHTPSHIAVVFDCATPTFRHETFADYKANRDRPPDDIIHAIADIRALLAGFAIPIIEKEGYEADDIIGTLSERAKREHFVTYMVTPDKDYGQLVGPTTFIYQPSRQKIPAQILGEAQICEKWGITQPAQVIDMLALVGDSVDNIPGVSGIGEKGAAKLLTQYGSLANIIAQAPHIPGSIGEKIRNGLDNAQLSYELARIDVNVPVEVHWDDLILQPLHKERLLPIFEQLEFRSIQKRLFTGGQEQTNPTPKPKETHLHTIANTPHTYTCLQDVDDIQRFLQALSSEHTICLDVETTGLDPYTNKLVGLSFSVQKQYATFIFLPEHGELRESILSVLRSFFIDKRALWVGQNIKFDLGFLYQAGCCVQGDFFDTMIAQYLLDSSQPRSMDVLAQKYLHYKPIAFADLFPGGAARPSELYTVPLGHLADYAAEDADLTLQLHDILRDQLQQNDLYRLFVEVEMPLLPILLEMEQTGIAIDEAYLANLGKSFQQKQNTLQKQIFSQTGRIFNLSSPRQLGEVLFDSLGYTLPNGTIPKTATGHYATNEAVLTQLSASYPVARCVLQYRECEKLHSTYVTGLLKTVRHGRVHTQFNQSAVVTGRLSSQQPNLQNIPIRTEEGKQIRRAFVALPGTVLLSIDYSQIELRIAAALSADENMIADFKQGQDIHTATASRIFGVLAEDVTADMRRKAKSVNFGILYGQSAFGLAQNLRIPRAEAKQLIDHYFSRYTAIRAYMDNQIEFARNKGYVQSLLGRVRYLPNILSENTTLRNHDERNAINMPIQATAADMIKKAMVKLAPLLRERGATLLVQVHDELLICVPEHQVDELSKIAGETMRTALPLPQEVPVEVSIGVGTNWLDAHS